MTIRWSVFMLQKLEDVSLLFRVGQLDLILGLLERITDLLLIKKKAIERVSEGNDCVVFDLVLLLNTDHVLGASLLENLSYEFRVTSGNDNELQGIFAIVLLNHLFESLRADKTSTPVFCLKKQKVSLPFIHFEKLRAELD